MSSVKLNTTGGSGGSVALKGPASTTSNADVELTLPVDDGTANQYLKTDGSGALSWSTVSTTDSSKVAKTGDTMTGELTLDTSATASTVCETLKAPQNERLSVWKNNDNGNGSWYAGGDASNVMDLQWNSYSAQVIKFKNAGDVEVLTGNLKISTAGKGIDFSATSDSSGTDSSELFDDYEEGTWTPALTNGPSLDNAKGYYTKIGRVVHAAFYFDTGTDGSHSGHVYINNLPFTSATDAGGYNDVGAGGVAWDYGSNSSIPRGHIPSNQTKVYMYDQTGAALQAGNIYHFDNKDWRGLATYITAS